MGRYFLRDFITLVSNDPLRKGEAIVLLEGDGFARVDETARLFKEGYAPNVFSGIADNPDYGSFPLSVVKPKLLAAGIPENAIIHEDQSTNTREQAVEIMKLVEKHGWKTILLVASHYHQYRAFLTFLQAMKESNLNIDIINAPARNLSWIEQTPWGRRIDLLEAEFERIDKYRELGHIASYEEAVKYLTIREA